jgi:hypothetical protein
LGARLITRKGRNLLAAITACTCQHYSTGEPTYWPANPNRLPDLLDFLVARGLPTTDLQLESVFELSSDHSPIIVTLGISPSHQAAAPSLTTTYTDWDMFRAYIKEHINFRIRIKEDAELDEAVHSFTTLL